MHGHGQVPPPATVHSALQESSSGQCKSLYLSLIHRMDNKGDQGFPQCLGLKMYLVTFWFCSDLYVSGDENLVSLKVTAIIMLFCFPLGLSLRIMTDYQGSVIITFM